MAEKNWPVPGQLVRRVQHDCPKPTVEQPKLSHRWVCPDCGAQWRWTPRLLHCSRLEHYGFLWLRTRTVEVIPKEPGWWTLVSRPEAWEPVAAPQHEGSAS